MGRPRGIRIKPPEGPADETDISMTMAPLGTRAKTVSPGGLELAVETDGLFVRTRSKAALVLRATDSKASRLRLGLEGSLPVAVEEVGSLVPSIGLGMRRDGGDAESGYGMDVRGDLTMHGGESGSSAELRGRGLLAHVAGDFRDAGVSGSVRFDPDPSSDRGPSWSLTTSRGESSYWGMGTLWNAETVGGLPREAFRRRATSVKAEIGYGLPCTGGAFICEPTMGMELAGSGQTYRTGFTLTLEKSRGVDLEFGTEVHRSVGEDGGGHGVGITFGLHR